LHYFIFYLHYGSNCNVAAVACLACEDLVLGYGCDRTGYEDPEGEEMYSSTLPSRKTQYPL